MSSPKSILLVEDEEIIQTLCKRLLKRPSLRLDVTGSVGEALALIPKNPYDLLITDLRLPDGEGGEVIAAFRKALPKGRIMVITGSPSPRARVPEDSWKNIAVVVSKPFEIAELVRAVEKVLEAGSA